jgi:DNA-binding response OmpR family regulator
MLLDVIMPIFDGFEVLKKLKESGALGTMKVIILSNLGQKEDIERGLQLGATDYIIKAHFTPSEVMEKVKQVVSK